MEGKTYTSRLFVGVRRGRRRGRWVSASVFFMSGNESPRPGRPRPGPPDRAQRAAELARGIGAYTVIPVMMAVGPVLGYLLGSWLESKFGHAPWLSFGCVILGAAASVRQIILILRRAQPRESEDQR